MNAVIYYSNTGESKKIAQYVSTQLGYPLVDMLSLTGFSFDKLVVVFPVHCQNIPAEIAPVLKRIKSDHTVVLATYGKMAFGNVLRQCQKRYAWRMVGGAYIPTRHSYLPADRPFAQWEKLDFVRRCLLSDREVIFPRRFQNPLSNILPGLRSRLGVKIVRGVNCTGCGLCEAVCTNRKCIRCLKCVNACPAGALSVRLNPFMALYLKKRPKNHVVIYEK